MKRSLQLLLLALAALLPPAAVQAQAPTGEQVYKQLCASCHGARGEGSDDYPRELQGSRTVPQLSKYIAHSMPKDAPRKCTADQAEKVAAYIHEAFYSREARERSRPPRIELSRLTVRQYRNAAADLVESFRSPGKWEEQHGLKGEYFKSRRYNNSERVLDRLDPTVRFDFGTTSPVADKLDPHQFSIRWQGSVLAQETGEYEFIVRSDHAVRLWVNDPNKPLVDALVKSGNDLDHTGTIYLLGGRAYSVRLEFSKAKQGVDDSAKNKDRPVPPAQVALLWKPPRRAVEVVPPHCLSPAHFPETFVLATAFPPDDRSMGWERGTSISKEWERAATDAAIETTAYVVKHLRELSGAPDTGADRAARLKEFCRQFAERAFRRPLTDAQKQFFLERQFGRSPDPETAVKRVLLLVLNSPRFLYREPDGGNDSYDVAARLSFGLWDSLPDAPLLQAAASGQLATPDQVRHQAERMVADLRVRSKVREFFLQWLRVDQVPEIAKDAKRYPDFDAVVASDLRTSLDLFLEDVVWGPNADFRQLFTADYLYLNGRLAKLYGAELPAEAPFQKVSLQPRERAGVLTHPYLMSVFAYTGSSSPIHRGVFLVRGVLGLSLRPPPEAIVPLAPDLRPDLTTRQRVALQTSPQSCMSCHGVINPLGFTLEHFDAVGRFRDQENGKAIDASGVYLTRNGATVKFKGARDLAAFVAGNREVSDALVQHLFQHLVKQSLNAYGPSTPAALRQAFIDNRYNLRRLMVDIMVSSVLTPAKKGQ